MSASNNIQLFGKVLYTPKYLQQSEKRKTSVINFTLVVPRSGTELVNFISCVAFGSIADEIKEIQLEEEILVQGEWRVDSIKKDNKIEYKNYCLVTSFTFTKLHDELKRKEIEETLLEQYQNDFEVTDDSPFI